MRLPGGPWANFRLEKEGDKMITVRSIITEALSRANLVSRRQQAPADMFETAYQLLKGIAKRYSDDNLLQFLVSEARHDLDAREFVVGRAAAQVPG